MHVCIAQKYELSKVIGVVTLEICVFLLYVLDARSVLPHYLFLNVYFYF